MFRFISPLAWFFAIAAFCLCSWYAVETWNAEELRGTVKELRAEIETMETAKRNLDVVVFMTHGKAEKDSPTLANFIEVAYQEKMGAPLTDAMFETLVDEGEKEEEVSDAK